MTTPETAKLPHMEEVQHDKPLDMRYDGAMRRSQKAKPQWIDRIWNFFSSVKVGIWLIALTLVATFIGSLYPQQSAFLSPPDEAYYTETYGTLGQWYYVLGFSQTYESWWFLTLIVLLATSIVIASFDRGIPLYRILKNQPVARSSSFLCGQQIHETYALSEPLQHTSLVEALRQQRFTVQQQGEALLAEKNRWSRMGPYVNHIGLIIFLICAFIRSFPGLSYEAYVSILEGDVVPIAQTAYFIKNEQFTIAWHESTDGGPPLKKDQATPKRFETKVTLYTCEQRCQSDEPALKEVTRGVVAVNEPFRYRGMALYQLGYDVTPQIRSITVRLRDKRNNTSYGPLTLKTNNPARTYTAGPYTLQLINYFPDFALDKAGNPTTVSANTPNAPAYVLDIRGGDAPAQGWTYVYFPREVDKMRFRQAELNARVGSGERWELSADGMKNVDIATYTSTLVMRDDQTLPYLLIGAVISMVGLVMGFYWQHRRIWLCWDAHRLVLAAHTNKNHFGLQREVQHMREALHRIGIATPVAQQQEGSA